MEAHSFLHAPVSPGELLQGHYQWGLVLLSILVSIFSTTMALHSAQIARRTQGSPFQHIALLTGAFALSGGIWTMHFIGMLAYELPVRVDYNTRLTLLSFVPAFISSWLALRLLAEPLISTSRLIISGILTGIGIGVMHYVGMAAMETSAHHYYDPFTFALSLIVAMGLATLALWTRFGLKRTALSHSQRFYLSGALMGCAIAGMHYVGMAGIQFVGEPQVHSKDLNLNPTFVSIALSSVTITVTLMVAALNSLLHTRELYTRIEGSQSRLTATLDTAVDGIITIDSKGLIQGFNRSAERLFGWSAEEVLGQNIKILMPDPDRSRHDDYLQNYHQSGSPKIIGIGREVMGLRKDGSLMPMRLAVGRMDLPDELLFVGFVSDISERHALEASLRETAERAEQAAAAKSIFLANMSHEIRTPMNSIIGFTELLLQSSLDETQRKQLGNIRSASRNLLSLINDILDTTKMEKGHMQLDIQDFSLEGLALQIESSLWPAAQQRQLRLTTDYSSSMPKYFKGDALRILQILNNLVGNAIKFTEQGEVQVRYRYENATVHIQVIDTGIGMTEEQVERVFAPFTQADASISRRFGGTGLGTTISRQLVELMHGRIEVHSQLNQGTTFDVWLPLPLGSTSHEQNAQQALPKLAPQRILIADDIAQNLELLALTLEGQGHQVSMAHDGQDAFEAFTREPFDVVLMDMHMPRIDGLQATRLIRQYEQQQGRTPTPIIALTASVMSDDRRAARLAGMNGFSVKPLDIPHLFHEIARVLQKPDADEVLPEPAVAPHSAALAMIDWTQGIARWGSQARLQQAIEQFLRKQLEQYPLNLALAPERLRFNLHSIRGAAANLALRRVADLASTLETQLKTTERLPTQEQLDQLQQHLLQVSNSFAAAPAPQDTRRPTAPSNANSLAEALAKLQQVLASNTLDDPILEQACQALIDEQHMTHADRLRQLIENFEFDAALSLLAELRSLEPAAHAL